MNCDSYVALFLDMSSGPMKEVACGEFGSVPAYANKWDRKKTVVRSQKSVTETKRQKSLSLFPNKEIIP